MSVKLVYSDIAVGADQDANVNTATGTDFSNPSLLPFGSSYPAVSSLEVNAWPLDGSRTLMPVSNIPFWSVILSGKDAKFANPPSITIDFTKNYTSLGIYLIFSPGTNEYCTELTVKWFRGSALLVEEVYHPDGPEFFCEARAEAYNKVVITFKETNLPVRRAKLNQILFGIKRTFGLDELRQVRVTEQVDPISEEVAINTMDFTLDSKEDADYLFQLKQPIYAYDGERLIGAFYVDSSEQMGAGLYNVSCTDAIGVLDDGETLPAEMYTVKNAKEALTEALGGYFELDLDPTLENETLTGLRPEGSRREALHQICFALRAMVDTSGTDKIKVWRDENGTPAEIPASRTYTGGSVTTKAIVTEVRVTAHTYRTTGPGEEITVGDTTYYHTTAVLSKKNPLATASDKQNIVEVTDATLVNTNNGAAVLDAVYGETTKRNSHNVRFVVDSETPGELVKTLPPWGKPIEGRLVQMNITLSGIAAADSVVT